MIKERHFTRCVGAAAYPPRGARPRKQAQMLHGERRLLSSAGGRINHVFMVATRRLPGFEHGMLERLLRLAGGFQRISLAVHAADRAEIGALVNGLGLAADIDMITAPEGAAL